MKRLYFQILIPLALVFGDHVIARGVAGFDTFAYVFPKFLYLVDTMGSGHSGILFTTPAITFWPRA